MFKVSIYLNFPDPVNFVHFGTMKYSIFNINLISNHEHYLHMNLHICIFLCF